MTSPPTTERDYAYVPISPETRRLIRVAKAEDGVSYDEYFRENLPLSE